VRWTTVEAVERRWRARACSVLGYSGSKLVHYSPPEQHAHVQPGYSAPLWWPTGTIRSGRVRVGEWRTSGGRWNGSGVCACSELEFSGSKLVHYSPPEQHERGRPDCPAPRWQRSWERQTRQPPSCSVPDIQGSTRSGLAKGEVFRGAPRWPQRDPQIGSKALCSRPTDGWGGGRREGREGSNTASLAEPVVEAGVVYGGIIKYNNRIIDR